MSVPGDSSQIDARTQQQGQQYGLGVGSMVCGIAAIPGALLIAILGIGLGVVAIVLAVVVRRNPGPRPGFAKAGLITGIIALVLGITNSIFGGLLFSGRL